MINTLSVCRLLEHFKLYIHVHVLVLQSNLNLYSQHTTVFLDFSTVEKLTKREKSPALSIYPLNKSLHYIIYMYNTYLKFVVFVPFL